MKSFLHITGALVIGIMIAAGLTFPAVLIGAGIGYLVIQESMSGKAPQNHMNSSEPAPTFKPWERQDAGTW